MRTLQNVGQALRDIVAPARCVGCLREGIWLCRTCRQRMPAYQLTCIQCEQPRARGATCPDCQSETRLKGVISVGPYGSPLLRRGIHWLKFKGARSVAGILADLLVARLLILAPLEQLQQEAVLVPIPLHKRRLRQRGFNQSLDIARALEERVGITCSEGLIRQHSTWTQTKLPAELRARNVSRSFAWQAQPSLKLPPSPRLRRTSRRGEAQSLPKRRYWLLIDDVTTSGSTLSAAAEALHQAGAKEIWGMTIARG